MAITDPTERSNKGYDDKKEFTCVVCGDKVYLTKFASAKTAKCDTCKGKNVQPNPDILAKVTTNKSVRSSGGDTKVCECIQCGMEVTVTKFASAAKVLCESCKGTNKPISDNGTPMREIKVDLNKLDRNSLPALDEYFVLPTIINNPRLRDVKCPGCGHESMRILKILDGSDSGLIIAYQCTSCFTMVHISEQCDHMTSPQRPGHFFNYRGEEIKSLISAITDTRVRNTIDRLMMLLYDNNIEITGIDWPEYTRPYQKLIPTGINADQTEVNVKTIDDTIKLFRDAHREGTTTDVPEGTRYIKISDTLANTLVERWLQIMRICRDKKLAEAEEHTI